MMANEYLEKIQNALNANKINPYMADKLGKAVVSGINNNLFEEVLADAQNASDIGVKSDKDYNQYFYICNFLEDILKDTFGTKLEDEDKKHFCKYFFSKEGANLDSLTDLRILVHKWLCDKLSKTAYPNIAGKYNRGPMYDVNKWATTLQHMTNLVNAGTISRDIAFENLTKDWEDEEKVSFKNWIRYYEENNTEKYKVKTAKFIKEAFGPIHINLPNNLLENRAPAAPNISTFKADDRKTQKELDMDKAKALKTKMKSRIRALKMLVDKYNDVLPHQDLDKLFAEVHSLEKSISKLNVHASLQDRIIRSANTMMKLGFSEGADLLYKTAEEPNKVMEALPEPTPDTPNLPEGSAASVSIQGVIARLEGVNKRLASRDLIRELAAVDILLNELGLASYFPELSLAQSKLIEAFGYANNKVEDVTARLRGTGTSKPVEKKTPEPAPLPVAPVAPGGAASTPVESIKTDELMGKPVGQVQKELPVAAPTPAPAKK